MRKFLSLAAAAALVLGAGSAFAASPSFTTIDNPGDPTFNQLLGISNTGEIFGYFGSGAAGHPNQAYSIAAPYTKFMPLNVPGSVQTQVTGVSGSMLVGFFSGTDLGLSSGGAPQDANYGWIRVQLSSGKNQYILVDDLAAGVPATAQVLGINASANAVGFYVDAKGTSHGFAYAVGTAIYTPISIVGSAGVSATAINKNNLVAGFYADTKGVTHGFLTALSGGAPVTFSVPGAQTTQFLGINDNGEVVGTYQLTPNDITHGLLYNQTTGAWTTLDDPNGVGGTVINGVNDKNQAVGFYTDAAGNVDGMLINNAF